MSGELHTIEAGRLLDVALAEALGWEWRIWGWRGESEHSALLRPDEFVGSGRVATRVEALSVSLFGDWDRTVPHFATRDGFWRLVEECERRDWKWGVTRERADSYAPLKYEVMVKGGYYLMSDWTHDFAAPDADPCELFARAVLAYLRPETYGYCTTL